MIEAVVLPIIGMMALVLAVFFGFCAGAAISDNRRDRVTAAVLLCCAFAMSAIGHGLLP